MSNKLFTTIPVPRFPRSTFSLSRPVLFTPRMHKEYPTEIIEIIPGDGIKIHTEAYAKSQPMVVPTFAKMDVSQECFFVPCWQLSEFFDDFITGGDRGEFDEKMPFVTVGFIYDVLRQMLNGYFGLSQVAENAAAYNEYLTYFQDILESFDIMRSIPFVVPDFVLMPDSSWSANVASSNTSAYVSLNSFLASSSLRINLLPFGANLKIWCEFYRDENLCEDLFDMYWKGTETALDLSKQTGNMDSAFNQYLNTGKPYSTMIQTYHALFGLKSRAWKKDYYTSALPFVQKGPDVMLPIDGLVQFTGPATGTQYGSIQASWAAPSGAGRQIGNFVANDPGGNPVDIEGRVTASQVGASIQDVRTAFKLEEMYEADGRFGNRYPENTLGQFGVHTPDSRLPRCQFLGSNKQPIQIAQVIQNSSTDATSPQGNLAGLSSTYGSNKLCKTYQSQHGFLVALTAIRVHSLYQQGIHPMFSRYDRTEYAWPRFAHLGEQPIYTKQLYVDANLTEDDVFGYTPRYAEYKSDTGSIHGKLKGSLNYWTMARRFANKPVLNEEFIYSKPRQDAFVVTNHLEPCFIMELDYHVRANRVLPFYGQPHM